MFFGSKLNRQETGCYALNGVKMKNRALLTSCAVLVLTTNAVQASDSVIAPEPENVEYVRVCDAYGAGYFYLPGTETCLRIHGYLRHDVKAGDDAYNGRERSGWGYSYRIAFQTSTATETDLGTLKTFSEVRFNYAANNFRGQSSVTSSATDLHFAYIQLGGFRVGLDDTEFKTFTGYLGSVASDTVVRHGTETTGKISYTYKKDGFSAVLALEQGGDGYAIDGYVPHVLAGLKYQGDWGSIIGITAYDSVIEDWSTKIRGNLNVSDRLSVWAQGGYTSNETDDQNYGQWGGDWAVWGGFKYKATKQTTANFQAAYEDWGKTAVTANLAYELVPGFTITPEISYTRWDRDHPHRVDATVGAADALQGLVRFQRTF